MSLDPAQLEAAIRRDDAEAVRELLSTATEAQRAAGAKALKPFLTGPTWREPDLVMLAPQQFAAFLQSGFQDPPEAIRRQEQQQEELNRDYDAWREIASGLAFQLAALGLAGGRAAAERVARDFPPFWHQPDTYIDLVAGVLADRSPAWLADFVDGQLRSPWGGIPAWPVARILVRLGAIQPPDLPEYVTLMPGGARRLIAGPDGKAVQQSPAEALLSDPGLLEDEVWRLFTVPDAGLVLEQADGKASWLEDIGRGPAQTWSSDLAQLCAAGHIDRDRLLDACLDAFTRGFNPNRVDWYAAMLAQLDPTADEMAARAPKYLRLLSSNARSGVRRGQAGAARLLAAGRLDPGELLAASAPALLFPQKNIASAQLKLIGQVAARHPDARRHAAATAASAFGHDRPDIQAAALALIRKMGVPDGAFLAEIRAHAEGLSPSLLADAAALGLTSQIQAPADVAPDAGLATTLAALADRIRSLPSAVAAGPGAALVLARSGAVPGPASVHTSAGAALPPPVTDPGELIQLLAVLIEDAQDAMTAERALAGAVRLSSLPAPERARLAAPLLKRARQIARTYSPFCGDLITSDMALITLVWSGELPASKLRPPAEESWNPGNSAVSPAGQALTMAGIFSARALEAARLIEAGRGGVLLAEPETERGAITAATLLRRVGELAGHRHQAAGSHDRDVALLRLVPGDAGELWTAWAPVEGVTAGALRDSHQLIQAPVALEAVTGNPSGRPYRQYSEQWHEHVLVRTPGPALSASACRCWQLLTALADPLGQHETLYGPSRYETRHYSAAVAGWVLICPWQPELAAAHLLRPLSDGLIPGLTPAITALLSMRHPGHPLGPVGHLALVTGLASAEADTRIAAAQLWSDACADGRLDPVLAAAALVTGVRGRALKLSRIADGLQHAAHTALGARRIVETVCLAMEGPRPVVAANQHLLFELAAQLGAAVGVPELPVAVSELAGRRGGSRLATTAAQLVQAQAGPAPDRGRAAAQALEALVARAEEAGAARSAPV
jgi:hypothetical protein